VDSTETEQPRAATWFCAKTGRLLGFLVVLLGTAGLSYALVGHRILAGIYERRSLSFLNALIQHRDEHPLSHYYERADHWARSGLSLSLFLGTIVALSVSSKRWRGLFLVAAVNMAVLEGALRLTNVFHPFFRPHQFIDTYAERWLEGYDMKNGFTRLYVYEPKPGATTYGHPFHVNHWGFRGRDFLGRSAVGSNTFRILVLGDSLTAGIGVAEEDRYTEVLEKKLRAKYSNVRLEVINLGVHGYETLQEYKTLQRMLPVIRPDLTIVGFYENDPNLHYEYVTQPTLPVVGRLRRILEKSLCFRVVESIYGPAIIRIRRLPTNGAEIEEAYKPNSRDWRVFDESVDGIANLVSTLHRGKPLVIGLTDPIEAKRLGHYWPPRKDFEKHGFIWLDWTDQGPYEPVSRFEYHPNERTHSRYAEALFRKIVELDIIPRRQESKQAERHHS
jgi:hypothetical protein